MKTIHVSTGSPYDIMIERGILDNCGEIIKKLSNAEKITIVTDTKCCSAVQMESSQLSFAAGLSDYRPCFSGGRAVKKS